MSTQSESLQDKIARLRQSFFTKLPERIDKIEQDVLQLRQSPENVDIFNELYRRVHNIKGASASFGLKDLSQLANELETQLKQMREQAHYSNPAIMKSIQALVQRLRQTITQLLETQSIQDTQFPIFELPKVVSLEHDTDKQIPVIYICDDDLDLQETLQAQLSYFSYKTHGFTHPNALLKAVQEQAPDVILMDIVFPESNTTGIDCINELQRQGVHIPVIFMSARGDFEARLHSVKAGGQSYFTKPFKVMDLVNTLDALLVAQEPAPYRILIIDDDVSVAQYHRLILEQAGMSVCTVYHAKTAFSVIFDYKPDLILMDMYMPLCNGIELAKLIRQIPEFLTLPIVYLSSETDMHRQFSALKIGADGFLTKPITPERLISEVLLRTERMAILHTFMIRDSLTGLLNHTAILNALTTMLSSAKRRNESLGFVMLDIDHFKRVNDTHGHAVGDQVLLALSRILKQRLRKSDCIGRYGGEEFALVLPAINSEFATQIINELREAFQKVAFASQQGDFFCTLSGGIAMFPYYKNVHDLTHSADSALYTAKKLGRNTIVQAT